MAGQSFFTPVSAYKHILRANTDKHGTNTLTPDEREVIARNFIGYDISPDMVRLSLVNLYLHGFTQPRIYEYDTLTSQERWNDYADVILANPPFMSPKGGIKPHNRFSVQSKRSEVLFVDYMAEHLKPTGRAAIIVPEGIIFQSQTAYKQLRKMLVEDSLVAVVSLPAGVFNPYSGVKTSILILDKALAQRTDSIAFLKIENDGFGLGAQRRVSEKNDLPAAAAFLAGYFEAIREQSSANRNHLAAEPAATYASSAIHDLPDRSDLPDLFSVASPAHCHIVPKAKIAAASSATHDLPDPTDLPDDSPVASPAHCHIVSKAKIAASGDYNLSGDRYVERVSRGLSNFPLRKLGDLCIIRTGKKDVNSSNENGRFPFFTCARKHTFSDEYSFDAEAILVAGNGDVGAVQYYSGKFEAYQRTYVLTDWIEAQGRYLYFLLSDRLKETVSKLKLGNTMPYIKLGMLTGFEIPLPPLDIQKQIVSEIEGYQKIIDGARAIVDNYRPHIDIDPSWPMVELKSVCETISDGDHQPPPKTNKGVPFVTIGNIDIKNDNKLNFEKTFFVDEAYYAKLTDSRRPQGGDILYTVTGSYGIPVIVPKNLRFCFQRHIALIRTGEKLLNRYLYFLLQTTLMRKQGDDAATGVAQKTVSLSSIRSFQIPLPSITVQQAIVAEIEAEQALVASTRELITRFEKKIQMVLAKVWGE